MWLKEKYITKICEQCGVSFNILIYKREGRKTIKTRGWQSRKYCDICSPLRPMIRNKNRAKECKRKYRMHIQKVKEQQHEWYLRNKEHKREYMRAYNARNKERIAERQRDYYHKNKTKCVPLEIENIEYAQSAEQHGNTIICTAKGDI